NILGVTEQTIQEKGTVSEACAYEMAEQIRIKFASQIGIGFTGVAGPDEMEGQPVGKVYIAISDKNGYKKVESFLFNGARSAVRKRACLKGLELLFNYLKS